MQNEKEKIQKETNPFYILIFHFDFCILRFELKS